jgi:hypothetical protein
MKKILFLSLVGLSASIFAQSSIELKDIDTSLLLAPNDTILAFTNSESSTHVNLDIKNISATDQHYNVKRYNVLLNTDAIAYFCFAGTCYGDQTFVSPTSLTLTAGQSASSMPGSFNNLTAYLDEALVVGNSIIKYTFINASNSSDSVQITIKYNGAPTTVGINKSVKSLSAFGIFPNPAKETTSLLLNAPKTIESTVQLFNSLGEVVYQKNILLNEGKNKIDLNLENLSGGVYFASIKTGESTISKKLILNR